MAKQSGTTRSSGSSNPKGYVLGGDVKSKASILDGFDETLKKKSLRII